MRYMVTWNISEENFGPAVERWKGGDEFWTRRRSRSSLKKPTTTSRGS
jgi:hypothetical protein